MDLIELNDFNDVKRHPWELARLKIVLDLLRKLGLNSESKILDVGSGDAFVAHTISRELSTEVMAVDINYDQNLLKDLKSHYKNEKLSLFDGLDKVKKIKNIRVVTLFDVIEHVEDDKKFLIDIIEHLKTDENVYFLISVPAYQSLFSAHDIQLKHYRRYSLEKLRVLAAHFNMVTIEKGYFFTSLLPVRIYDIVKEKIIKREANQKDLGSWKGGTFMTKTLTAILVVDYLTNRFMGKIGIRLPGLSCYSILKYQRDQQ